MTDAERRKAAHDFFWSMMGDTIVTAQEAERSIAALVRALPPFTPIKAKRP